MRTTVAIDDDLARALKQEAERQRASFTRTLNRVLRTGLQRGRPARRKKAYKVEPIDADFCPGIDPHQLKTLLLEDDVDALVEKLRDHS